MTSAARCRILCAGSLLASALACGGVVDDGRNQTGPGAGGSTGGLGARGGSSQAGAGNPSGGLGGAGIAGGAASGGCVGSGGPDDDRDRDGYPAPLDCDDLQNRVNPGAFDFPSNGVDDDCDGGIDNSPAATCDTEASPIPIDAQDPIRLLEAAGLCGSAKSEPGIARAGVRQATLWGLSASWTSSRNHLQHGVLTSFGKGILPKAGRTMLALSTATARTQFQPDGPAASPALQECVSEPLPNGFPENDAICIAASTGPDKLAWNPIAIRLAVRTPTNAVGLRWFARGVTVRRPYNAVCSGNNSFFGVYEGYYDGNGGPNRALLPDGSAFSIDHLPFVHCAPTTFEEGGRTYDYPCPSGQGALLDGKPWDGAATEWIEQSLALTPGKDVDLTMIVWAHGDDYCGEAFTVLLDDMQWIPAAGSAPLCDEP